MPRPIEDAFVPIIKDTIFGVLNDMRIPSMIVYYETFCCPCMSHLSAESCRWVCEFVGGIKNFLISSCRSKGNSHTLSVWLSITSGVPFDTFVHDDDISPYIGIN